MDMILNLVAVVGTWSSFALLAWGAALTLHQVFAPPTRATDARLAVELGPVPECYRERAASASSRGEPVAQNGRGSYLINSRGEQMKRLINAVFVLALTAPLLYPALVFAEKQWPSKPLHIVVPFPAGGATDVFARMVAQPLSEHLGQPVIVENRLGANGTIGTESVARAPADGYT